MALLPVLGHNLYLQILIETGYKSPLINVPDTVLWTHHGHPAYLHFPSLYIDYYKGLEWSGEGDTNKGFDNTRIVLLHHIEEEFTS